jgi:hypothetical protein
MTVVRLALLLIAAYVSEAALSPGQFGGLNRIAASSSPHCQLHQIRGGAAVDDDGDDYDVDDDDVIINTASNKKLATSTKTVAQRKKTAAIKSKVKVAMSSGSASTTSKSAPKKSLYKRYVPYIIRACLNPFTLIAMTKAYFVSLCDINYLKEVSLIARWLMTIRMMR